MNDVRHHPREETLAAFAAGGLDEACAVVIGAHACLCPGCSSVISEFEAIGGQLLHEAQPVEMAHDALEKILQRANQPANIVSEQSPAGDGPESRLPLSAYLKTSLDDVKWRRVGPGLSQCVLKAQGYRPNVLRLLKIAPGTAMPKHTHSGGELTLILRGAYTDEIGEFGVGDLADLSPDHTHQPKAVGDEPCICLIATAAPLRFKSLMGRLAQPFIGL